MLLFNFEPLAEAKKQLRNSLHRHYAAERMAMSTIFSGFAGWRASLERGIATVVLKLEPFARF